MVAARLGISLKGTVTDSNKFKSMAFIVGYLLLAINVNSLEFGKLSLSLPHSSPNLTARLQNLEKQKPKFINGPSFFKIDNQPGLFPMPNGPQYTPEWNELMESEISEIAQRSNASAFVTEQVIPYDLVVGGIPIETLDDLTEMFKNFTSLIHFPYSIVDWQKDSSFGQDRLSWGGYSLKAETTNYLNISDQTTFNLTGQSFFELIKQKRIYKVDYSDVGKYSKSNVGQENPLNQTIPSTYLNLYIDASGNPYPLAIKVIETGLVYTPLDAAEDWMFAKLAFSTSEGFYLPMEHFVVNHMALISARVELLRQVSIEHPVHALVNHHFKDSFGNIIFGVQALLQNGTAFDTVYGSGGLGAARYVGDRTLTYNFTAQKINNWFTAAGTTNVPNYKYMNDLVAIRSAVGTFVQNYLSIYYNSDADVRTDTEIQAWASNTASPAGGNIVGFPSSFSTLFSLSDTIADLIVFMTAQHNVMNGEATWDGQVFPVKPHAMYGPLPTAKGIPSSRAYLAPVSQLIAAELALHSAFLIPTPQTAQLGFSYGHALGNQSERSIKAFQTNLVKISTEIQKREEANPRNDNPHLLSYLDMLLGDANFCQSICLSNFQLSNSLQLFSGIRNSALHELQLNNCGIRGQDLQYFGAIISSLKVLDLRANRIMDSGCLELTKLIPNSKLLYLNLEMNGIGRIGMRNLCKVLPATQLSEIAINFNEFDSSSYRYLLEILPICKLKYLNIYRILDKELQLMFIDNLTKSNLVAATIYLENVCLETFANVSSTGILKEFCFFLGNDIDCKYFSNVNSRFKFQTIKLNFGKYVSQRGIIEALAKLKVSGRIVSLSFANSKLGNEGLERILEYISQIEPDDIDFSYFNDDLVIKMQLTAKLVTLLALPTAFAGIFNLFPPAQDFLSLPKNSPNITARNLQLATQQANFIDGPGFFTIANQPGYFPMPNGPQFTPTWYQLMLSEIGEIAYRSNASAFQAEQLIPYDLVAAGIPINTLTDLSNMYYNFTSAIRFPYAMINWQADASFGQDRLSWGGYSLKVETANVLNVADTITVQLTGLTFAQLLAQKRIYKVDYSTVGKYSKSNVGQANPFGQSVPSTYLNLYIDASGNPYPLAIKVIETGLVYTPLDAAEDWMFAKLAFSTSEGFYLPMEHFIVNHMSIIAARVELMRHVSVSHPVYALLSHHFKDSYGNIIFGVQALLQNGTAFDTVYGSGGLGAARYVGDRTLTYNFTAQKINNWFTAAGTTNVPNYKYMNDLVAIRSAVGTFVQNYLSIYYNSDADVRTDTEIQAWASNTASPAGGNIVGFPSSFSTLFSLSDTIADLIVFMTAQHNVMNGEATWDGQVFPVKPHAMYGPLPTAKGIPSSRAYLAPVSQLIAAELALHSAFLIPTPQT
ncbi:hypothetical protein HDV06_000402, partial [Boothiomyces sp. JEL0866]